MPSALWCMTLCYLCGTLCYVGHCSIMWDSSLFMCDIMLFMWDFVLFMCAIVYLWVTFCYLWVTLCYVCLILCYFHCRPQLLSLDLSNNNLSDILDNVQKLSTLPKLRNLVLQGNPLAVSGGHVKYTRHIMGNSSKRFTWSWTAGTAQSRTAHCLDFLETGNTIKLESYRLKLYLHWLHEYLKQYLLKLENN